MKKAFLLLFVFAATTAFAQNKKFSIGAAVMPLWSDVIIHNKSAPDQFVEAVRDYTNGLRGFNTHIFGEYSLTERILFRVGLGYSETGYTTDPDNVIWPDPTKPEITQLSWIHTDFSVPFLVKLRSQNRPNWYVLAGGTSWVNVFRQQKTTIWYPDGNVVSSRSNLNSPTTFPAYRKFNSSGTVGMGYEFYLKSAMYLFLEPTFSCNIRNIYLGNWGKYRTYTIGLNTGVRF
jgi:Outer membrane protein beta-barrel domain